MWTLVAIGIFLAFFVVGYIRNRRDRSSRAELERELHDVAEIAQRRHRQQYGRDDTGALRTMAPVNQRKPAHGRR